MSCHPCLLFHCKESYLLVEFTTFSGFWSLRAPGFFSQHSHYCDEVWTNSRLRWYGKYFENEKGLNLIDLGICFYAPTVYWHRVLSFISINRVYYPSGWWIRRTLFTGFWVDFLETYLSKGVCNPFPSPFPLSPLLIYIARSVCNLGPNQRDNCSG